MAQSHPAQLQLTTVRGLACLALVAYHVVGLGPDSGMHLPDSSPWHYTMNSFDFLRMPLFTVLSGYLYAGHRVDTASLAGFARKKGLRLGVPLLFVTTVMLLLRRFAYGDPTPLSAALLFHYQHLWFVQALIVIFTAVALMDSFARLTPIGLLVAAFGALMVSRSFDITLFFSLNGAFYLAPYFLFGMILRLQPGFLERRELLAPALWIVAIVMLLQQATTFEGGLQIARTSVPAALCGCAAAYFMIVRCPRIAVFERIGSYSYTIYLWHGIAAAGVRESLERIVQLPQLPEFMLLLAVGLAAPIAIHLFVSRVPVLCTLVAGLRRPLPQARGPVLAWPQWHPTIAGEPK